MPHQSSQRTHTLGDLIEKHRAQKVMSKKTETGSLTRFRHLRSKAGRAALLYAPAVANRYQLPRRYKKAIRGLAFPISLEPMARLSPGMTFWLFDAGTRPPYSTPVAEVATPSSRCSKQLHSLATSASGDTRLSSRTNTWLYAYISFCRNLRMDREQCLLHRSSCH